MSFAAEMAQVATDLLGEFDERSVDDKIQLKRNSAAVWDPILVEDVITPGATIDLTGVAVPYSQGLVDGTTIQSGDIKLTVTMATEPLAQDKVILDGAEHSIISIVPFAFTGKPLTIAYAIQIRR